MKNKILFGILVLFCSQFAYAQYEYPYKNESATSASSNPNFYLGIGTGLNYKTGAIGLSLAYRMAPKTLVELNMGIGGYGSKIGLGGVFNVIEKGTWCPSLSFSRASGGSDLPLTVEVEVPSSNGTATAKTDTKINLSPMFTLTPGVQRQFISKNGNRFILEFGFAIPLNTATQEFAESMAEVNGVMVPTSMLKFSSVQKTAFKLLDPAGLSLGLCYYFGFKPKN
jgi:hypothetical protein